METVNDVILEMRGECDHSGMVCFGEGGEVYLNALADRIDAAYKRDLQAMCDAGEIDMRTAMGEIERLREENERLRSAIVRVHGCTNATCGCMGACWTCELMRLGGAE